MKKNVYKKSAKVQWKWLGRQIFGTVEEIYLESITKTIKGKKITRHGTEECPAYLVRSGAGNVALKLQTELVKNVAPKKSSKKPSMFKG